MVVKVVSEALPAESVTMTVAVTVCVDVNVV